jgi:hypothetical protein
MVKIAADLLKTGAYVADAQLYVRFARLLRKDGNQPWFPFAKDHIQACLKRI